jgi:dihydropyrimidinase
MQFDTLIQGGTVVTASDTYKSDVGIKDGRITAIGASLPPESAKQVLNASGMMVIPGGIDVHTHLDMPFGGTVSADDFESGTIAAAHGGTTTAPSPPPTAAPPPSSTSPSRARAKPSATLLTPG